MKILAEALILVFFSIFLGSEHRICHAFSSNYNARTKCLVEPKTAQDGGGIIANPDFTHGMEGWAVHGQGAMKEEMSRNGNRFIVAYNRTQSLDSISQKVQLGGGLIYSFSAWIQINKGSERVAVVFKIPHTELVIGGRVLATNGCWSLLKGGIFANFTSHADILFESNNTATEIWVDSVSLQPFTLEQWRAQQDEKIDKERKSKVRFKVTYGNGTAMDSATVSIKQTRSEFPFGCGMNFHIIDSTDYQNWFASRFKYTTFTNQMKWYSNEPKQGQENYTVADTMVKFAQQNGISIRGHNILWDDPKYQPEWVKNLTSDELRKAAAKRVDSVVSRYAGQLIAWDVINENLHFSFFEDKLGKNASSRYFKRAYELDPKTTMFLNEFNTIEYSNDEDVDPISYMKKLGAILSYPGNQGILAGIGLEGHFGVGQPNLAYMRSVLDILSSTGLPLWLTEVDVVKEPNQAEYLEQILREGYCHHAVKGIIMFAGPATAGFNATTLVDKDFKNTPSGDVVDKLIDEWRTKPTETKADGEGYFEMSLFHGDYNITIKNPVTNCSTTLSYRLIRNSGVTSKGAMREGVSREGNMFIVACNRSKPSDSISQKVQLQQTKLYSFSAWVQISEGSETVDVIFKTTHGEWIRGGSVVAKHGCWSLLKGGMVAHLSGPVEIFFVCNNTRVEVWIDNVSFQPFTTQQWRSHQDKSIEEVRKRKVRFQVTYANGTALGGAAVSIKQTKSGFPFGCGMNHYILLSNAYQKWFASRFKFTTFTNEMKWYSTEKEQGHEDYTIADAMLSFAEKNGIAVRGHNILWDSPKMQPQWVKNLSPSELRIAATKRTDSVARRYSGKLIAWDVMNENMHFSFYEDKLGKNASSEYYLRAYQLDPKTIMFLNEFNTIEYSSTGLPIWLTEVDVQKGPNQAQYFESILREGYSHPAVKGIIIFAGPEVAGFSVITLADKDFKNTPSGNVVDKLIAEWKTGTLKVVADSQGFAEASLFQGDYNLIVKHPVTNLLTRLRFKAKEDKSQETTVLHVTD
ncbi:hypothetical protein NC652_023499 [Populus alba x Populus x berolinensis]|nr:hypothetical protein NC652_023499 [Populus alba x Populus x berolinensis]